MGAPRLKHGCRQLIYAQICILMALVKGSSTYFANWGDIGRNSEPTCVDIPKNMSLCSNIQYERMRLPNLLGHDTLTEVAQQSASWVPLLNVGCHLDTQLFLCSLFTPVCLEKPIYPCRSLCITVQQACERRMTTYGYSWPDMLNCDNFPEDNDMCLKAQSTARQPRINVVTESRRALSGTEEAACDVCSPVATYENIIDNFCRADIVLQSRMTPNLVLRGRKQKILKPILADDLPRTEQREVQQRRQALRRKELDMLNDSIRDCCSNVIQESGARQNFLIMGMEKNDSIEVTFVLPWPKDKTLRSAINSFNRMDCNDPSLFTADAVSGVIVRTPRPDGNKNVPRTGRMKNKKKRRRQQQRQQQQHQQRLQEQQIQPTDILSDLGIYATEFGAVSESPIETTTVPNVNRRKNGGNKRRRNGGAKKRKNRNRRRGANRNAAKRQRRNKKKNRNRGREIQDAAPESIAVSQEESFE